MLSAMSRRMTLSGRSCRRARCRTQKLSRGRDHALAHLLERAGDQRARRLGVAAAAELPRERVDVRLRPCCGTTPSLSRSRGRGRRAPCAFRRSSARVRRCRRDPPAARRTSRALRRPSRARRGRASRRRRACRALRQQSHAARPARTHRCAMYISSGIDAGRQQLGGDGVTARRRVAEPEARPCR